MSGDAVFFFSLQWGVGAGSMGGGGGWKGGVLGEGDLAVKKKILRKDRRGGGVVVSGRALEARPGRWQVS